MIRFDVRADLDSIRRQLNDIDERQLRYATQVALTNTALDCAAELRREMLRVFDRPKPFTLNSIRVKYATKRDLAAEVGIRNDGNRSQNPMETLGPEIYGGPRVPNNFEKLLRQRGVLPGGMFVVPGEGCKLNAYGGIASSTINQVLAATSSFHDPQQNATPRSKRRNKVVGATFALSQQRGALVAGVYQRLAGNKIVPILIFVRQPQYSVRLEFERIVRTVAQQRFERQFRFAAQLAASTARPLAAAA